jgi:hypothetical protein
MTVKLIEKKKVLPEDVASSNYSVFLQKSITKFKDLSKHGKDRVLNTILEVPFEKEKPQFPNKEEMSCYQTIEHMQLCKIMMLIAVIKSNPQFVGMIEDMFQEPQKEKKDGEKDLD